MSEASTNKSCNTTITDGKRITNIHRRSNLFFASVILCYGIFWILLSLKNKIISYDRFEKLGFSETHRGKIGIYDLVFYYKQLDNRRV